MEPFKDIDLVPSTNLAAILNFSSIQSELSSKFWA